MDSADGSPESLGLWENGHLTAIGAPDVSGQASLTGGYLNQAGQVAFSARAAVTGDPIGQNERGQVIVNLNTNPNGRVQAALFTVDWS